MRIVRRRTNEAFLAGRATLFSSDVFLAVYSAKQVRDALMPA